MIQPTNEKNETPEQFSNMSQISHLNKKAIKGCLQGDFLEAKLSIESAIDIVVEAIEMFVPSTISAGRIFNSAYNSCEDANLLASNVHQNYSSFVLVGLSRETTPLFSLPEWACSASEERKMAQLKICAPILLYNTAILCRCCGNYEKASSMLHLVLEIGDPSEFEEPLSLPEEVLLAKVRVAANAILGQTILHLLKEDTPRKRSEQITNALRFFASALELARKFSLCSDQEDASVLYKIFSSLGDLWLIQSHEGAWDAFEAASSFQFGVFEGAALQSEIFATEQNNQYSNASPAA